MYSHVFSNSSYPLTGEFIIKAIVHVFDNFDTVHYTPWY